MARPEGTHPANEHLGRISPASDFKRAPSPGARRRGLAARLCRCAGSLPPIAGVDKSSEFCVYWAARNQGRPRFSLARPGCRESTRLVSLAAEEQLADRGMRLLTIGPPPAAGPPSWLTT